MSEKLNFQLKIFHVSAAPTQSREERMVSCIGEIISELIAAHAESKGKSTFLVLRKDMQSCNAFTKL